MRRGTTPTFIFRLKDKDGQPFDTAGLIDIRVTFQQWGAPIVEKGFADCTYSGNAVSVSLSQEETLKFDHNKEVKIQLKGKTTDGKVIPTKVLSEPCSEILNVEVL